MNEPKKKVQKERDDDGELTRKKGGKSEEFEKINGLRENGKMIVRKIRNFAKRRNRREEREREERR